MMMKETNALHSVPMEEKQETLEVCLWPDLVFIDAIGDAPIGNDRANPNVQNSRL
jgi:hypothetical protein